MILKLVDSDKTRDQRIKAQIVEILDDHKEREEIQNNILIFNVPEADPDDEDKCMYVWHCTLGTAPQRCNAAYQSEMSEIQGINKM